MADPWARAWGRTMPLMATAIAEMIPLNPSTGAEIERLPVMSDSAYSATGFKLFSTSPVT